MNNEISMICAGLKNGNAPSYLALMLTLDDGTRDVAIQGGYKGQLSVDTFDGKRTSIIESHDNGVTNRITANDDHFLFEQLAPDLIMSERLEYSRICEPNPIDAIQEWLEAIQS
jgi:hypothetical protein